MGFSTAEPKTPVAVQPADVSHAVENGPVVIQDFRLRREVGPIEILLRDHRSADYDFADRPGVRTERFGPTCNRLVGNLDDPNFHFRRRSADADAGAAV